MENRSVRIPRAPGSKKTAAVCDGFAHLFHRERVGAGEDFLDLGGTREQAGELADFLRDRHGYGCSEESILRLKTPAAIGAELTDLQELSIPRCPELPSFIPLTDSQLGVYFECLQNPSSTTYNILFSAVLPEKTDLERLARAAEEAVQLYPALFCTFRMENGVPGMIPGKGEAEVPLMMTRNPEGAIRDFLRPFDLEKGPLFRMMILKSPGEARLLVEVHHLVFDGGSIAPLFGSIAEIYRGEKPDGERVSLLEEALARQSPEEKAAQKRARDWYSDYLKDRELGEHPRGDAVNHPVSHGLVTLPMDNLPLEETAGTLRRLGLSESTLFLGAFALTLSAYSGSREFSFTTASNGRSCKALSRTPGMFVKAIPLVGSVPAKGKVTEFLSSLQQDFYLAIRHDRISMGELSSRYGINTDFSFLYQGDMFSSLTLEGEVLFLDLPPVNDSNGDFLCMVAKRPSGYEIRAFFQESRYTEDFVRSFGETLRQVAGELLSKDLLEEISLLTASQQEKLEQWNETAMPYDSRETIQAMACRVFSTNPEQELLVDGSRRFTRGEVGERARAIAKRIAASGIGREDYVAVLSPRSAEGVLSVWGVFLSGAALQSLDPSYPPERLNFMVKDTVARLLIADRALRPLLKEYTGEVLYTDELFALPPCPDFQGESRPEDACAIIYTSGTTGTPKGSVLENRNLVAHVKSHERVMGLRGDSRLASYASFGFDAGLEDLLCCGTLGACLCILPDEMRLDLPEVDRFFRENRITYSFMTTQVARMFAGITTCPTLEVLLAGGEKLVPFNPPEGFRFVNAYGPCETMAYVCFHDVRDNSPVQPIGKPCPNVKLYLVDEEGRRVPAGATGEIWIAGPQVGRGYLNQPEKTALVFTENPFSREPGYERVYRTGDLGRMLPDGNLEFLARRDGQVKIRGNRVELTEVEEVIRRFPGVKDAAVTAFEEPGGGKFLSAYVVGEVSPEEVKAFIRREKPEYMVPSVVTLLSAIPYTQNQKVNRRALPRPEKSSSAKSAPVAASAENQITALVSDILGHSDFGPGENLFEAGLNSIGALKLNVELGKAFRTPVTIGMIREHPTVEELARLLGADPQPIPEQTEKTEKPEAQGDYPLLFNQMGVFLEGNGNLKYNIPCLFRVEMDLPRLVTAVEEAIHAHPMIQATLFTNPAGEVRFCRNDGAKPVVRLLSALPQPLVRPFRLLEEPLYRAEICETPEGNYLFLDLHHIIADGTSLAILLRDIGRAYRGEKLEGEAFTGFDFCGEEIPASRLEGSRAYFGTLLDGFEPDALPAPCPETREEGCGEVAFDFGALSGEITEWCRVHKVTGNAFFNAAFGYTLSRFLHREDVTYCTVYNGRNDSRKMDTVAMLVKTIPMRCLPEGEMPIEDYVRQVGDQLMDTITHDELPFGDLSREFGVKSELFFNYQGDNFVFEEIGGAKAEQVSLPTGEAKAPLSIEISLKNGVYSGLCVYRRDRFCRELLSSLTDALKMAAEGFLSREKLREVSLLSSSEKEAFARMNRTDCPFRRVPAQRLFEEYASAHLEQIAVKTLSSSLTFGELEERTNRVANGLLALGVQGNELIGLILDRGEGVPIAELAVMKAGCGFLPMLPTYPEDRLEYCLENAQCRFVLTTENILRDKKGLFEDSKPYRAVLLEELLQGTETACPQVEISQNSAAYCIYTSGSTGTPKGVVIEHHSLSNFVQTCGLREMESRGNALLCMSSISFDMSITEMFLTLSLGKTIYIAQEEEIHNLDLLRMAFLKNRIDLMMMTPSFAWSLLSMDGFREPLANLRGVVLGAEAFQPALLSKLKGLNPDMLVMNGYGPTECTQACSAKTLEEGDSITIGGPFANIRFYVADTAGNLLPRYAVGELMLCGEGVCRGYVRLPEKNAAAFTEIDGVKAYHSGDLVRINRDGEAEFGGRADNQVKLRGFRIELDEVEQVMQEYPGVRECKVIVRNNGTEDFLAGFFTGDGTIDVGKLTEFMKTKLNYYMVPGAMLQLDRMPMTANGKLDKKALPEIRPQKRERSRKAAKKSLEQRITEIFTQVLGQECFVDDNFFEIGGTSLSASKAVMQLKSTGCKVEYQDIFDHQTAEELAQYLEGSTPVQEHPEESGEGSLYRQEEGIGELLKFNAMEYAPEVKREPLGDVLLTGATGFLGIHILKTLLEEEQGRIVCLIRKGNFDSVENRLKATLVYYFEDDYEEAFRERITLVEGDITEADLPGKLEGISFDTVINCAASVKHYANDDSIFFVNVRGAENLIALTRQRNARMIQISTTSVPGVHNAQTHRVNLKMTEDHLFVIDDMNNQYGQSKYQAELRMLEAIRQGMRGKIIRVGNLMGRYSDGEFQTNMRTNAFLNGLRGFANLKKCPISHSTDPMTFSPVDCTARAVVLPSGTNDKFTAFNADTRFTFDEMKLIEAMNRRGLTITPVPDEEYYADFNRWMGDPQNNEKVSALLTNDRPDVHVVQTDNRFTANVLYRLGFSWPFVDDTYLDRLIEGLDTMDFFFRER